MRECGVSASRSCSINNRISLESCQALLLLITHLQPSLGAVYFNAKTKIMAVQPRNYHAQKMIPGTTIISGMSSCDLRARMTRSCTVSNFSL